MNLYLDAGNSRLKWQLGEDALQVGGMATASLTSTDLLACWRALPSPQMIVGVSVVGSEVQRRIAAAASALWGLSVRWLTVRDGAQGLRSAYSEPERLGADRWAAMLGALCCAVPGPLVIADCGTALTVDALDGHRHLGGIISPGLGLMKRALARGTVALAPAELEELQLPKTLLGRTTHEGIRAGTLAAVAGAIEAFAREVAEHCGTSPLCLLTGGDAPLIRPLLQIQTRLEPGLIFRGLEDWAGSLEGVAL